MASSRSKSPTTESGQLGVLPAPNELDFDVAPTAQRLAGLTRVFQLVLAIASLSWLALLVSEIILASTAQTSPSWAAAYDRVQTTETIALATSAVVLVVLIAWTTRAYKNLDAAGLADESPSRVLLSWFIPPANLLFPATALEELYLAGGNEGYEAAHNRSPLVWFWWFAGPLTFLLRLALLQIRPMLFPSGRLATILDVAEWSTDAAIAAACLAAILMAAKISANKAFEAS